MKSLNLLLLSLWLSLASLNAWAHEDIEITLQNNKIVVDSDHPILIDGYKLFEVDFDNTITPFITKDPGLVGSGFPITGSLIHYQLESTLKKWHEDSHEWLSVGFPERMQITGSSITNIASASQGPHSQGLIRHVGSTGGLHSHLTFEIGTSNDSNPDDGAYLLEMSLFGTESDGSTPLHTPSERFLLAFHLNAGGTFPDDEFEHALEYVKVDQPSTIDAARIDELFDWAEQRFVELFPHHQHSGFIFGYWARCYDNGVCLGAKDGYVYLSGGPFGLITNVGPLNHFFKQAGLMTSFTVARS